MLTGRRAIITGAGSGIGEAIALAYAAQGARLWLVDRDEHGLHRVVQACAELGAEVDFSVADLGTAQQPGQAMAAAIEGMQGVDILVNSAGIATQGLCTELTCAVWDEMLAVNLRSVFLCSRAVVPSMQAQRWGRIINIASQLGIKGAPGLSHYAAAKAGMIGFTKSLALELASFNVLVNAIAPGPIDTPMIAGISEEFKQLKAAELPLGRFGTANEVAPTAVLLASDPGGNLYLGQTLGPNSGDVMP
jgi:3-oxoacyl-[acyl-carrier protein] reductase